MTDDEVELQRLLAKLQSGDIMAASQAHVEIIKLGQIAIESLIALVKDDSKSGIWYLAASSLGHLGDARAVEPLIDLLKNPLSFDAILSRKYTAYALAQLKDNRAVDVLLEMLHECLRYEEDDRPDDETILAAAEALTAIGDIRALEPIINRIFEEDDYWQNGDTLSIWGEPALKLLLDLLSSEDAQKRSDAAELLGDFGDQRAVEPLIQQLKNDPSDNVRSSAAYALSMLGDSRATDALTSALKNTHEQTRYWARIGLDNIKLARE